MTYVRNAFAAVGAMATIVFAIGGVGSVIEKLDKSIEALTSLVQWWKLYWYPIPQWFGIRTSDFSKDLIGLALAELVVIWAASYLMHRRTLAFHFVNSLRWWRFSTWPKFAPWLQQTLIIHTKIKGHSKAISAAGSSVRQRSRSAVGLLLSMLGFAVWVFVGTFILLTLAIILLLVLPTFRTLTLYPRTALVTLLLLSTVMMVNYFK